MSLPLFPLINRSDTVITNDWYYEGDRTSLDGFHVTEIGSLKNIELQVVGCKLMCMLCLHHFSVHKLKKVYVEYYWEQNNTTKFNMDSNICSSCYLMCVDLLEQELPDCKEPDE